MALLADEAWGFLVIFGICFEAENLSDVSSETIGRRRMLKRYSIGYQTELLRESRDG